MSTATHTSGPWKVMAMDEGLSINQEAAETFMELSIAGLYGDYEQNEPNSRLIAAAPDLLEALESVLRDHVEFGGLHIDTAIKVITAINKAKGL